MGMYNVVKINIPCPKCGGNVGEFQTKDETFDALYLELVKFWTVREFYSICDNCDTWISVRVKLERLEKLTLDDYEIIARPLGGSLADTPLVGE